MVSAETFNVTLYANEMAIATLYNVSLASRGNGVAEFTWNTRGFVQGNYSVFAVADTVLGEIDHGDNSRTCGVIIVAKPCDINVDGKVDLKDVFAMIRACGSFPDRSNWNPNCDIDDDGRIHLKDYYIMSKHFGRTDP